MLVAALVLVETIQGTHFLRFAPHSIETQLGYRVRDRLGLAFNGTARRLTRSCSMCGVGLI